MFQLRARNEENDSGVDEETEFFRIVASTT